MLLRWWWWWWCSGGGGGGTSSTLLSAFAAAASAFVSTHSTCCLRTRTEEEEKEEAASETGEPISEVGVESPSFPFLSFSFSVHVPAHLLQEIEFNSVRRGTMAGLPRPLHRQTDKLTDRSDGRGRRRHTPAESLWHFLR